MGVTWYWHDGCFMHQPARDLFGQVPITLQDVRAWLIAVPRIDPDSPRAARYFTSYNVTQKIAAAKIAGTFEQAVHNREQPAGALVAALQVGLGRRQFSTLSPLTRENSPVLSVTMMKPCAMAAPAIIESRSPIDVPALARVA